MNKETIYHLYIEFFTIQTEIIFLINYPETKLALILKGNVKSYIKSVSDLSEYFASI